MQSLLRFSHQALVIALYVADQASTLAVLLTGMVVALIVIKLRWEPVPAIVLAQAVTVVAAPILAGTLLWLTSLRSVMGEHRVGWLTKLLAALAFLLLLAMAGYTAAVKIPEGLQNLRATRQQAAVSEVESDTASLDDAKSQR